MKSQGADEENLATDDFELEATTDAEAQDDENPESPGEISVDRTKDEGNENQDAEPQPSRGDTRSHRLAQRLAEERAEKQALREQLTSLLNGFNAPRQADPEREAREEAERLAVMPIEEQVRYLVGKQERNTRQALAGQSAQVAELVDQLSFRQTMSERPLARRLAGKVEETLRRERQDGRYWSRDAVLRYLIGDEVLAKSERAGEKARRTASAVLANQTSRPGNPRSSQAARPTKPSSGSEDEDLEELFARVRDVRLE